MAPFAPGSIEARAAAQAAAEASEKIKALAELESQHAAKEREVLNLKGKLNEYEQHILEIDQNASDHYTKKDRPALLEQAQTLFSEQVKPALLEEAKLRQQVVEGLINSGNFEGDQLDALAGIEQEIANIESMQFVDPGERPRQERDQEVLDRGPSKSGKETVQMDAPPEMEVFEGGETVEELQQRWREVRREYTEVAGQAMELTQDIQFLSKLEGAGEDNIEVKKQRRWAMPKVMVNGEQIGLEHFEDIERDLDVLNLIDKKDSVVLSINEYTQARKELRESKTGETKKRLEDATVAVKEAIMKLLESKTILEKQREPLLKKVETLSLQTDAIEGRIQMLMKAEKEQDDDLEEIPAENIFELVQETPEETEYRKAS